MDRVCTQDMVREIGQGLRQYLLNRQLREIEH